MACCTMAPAGQPRIPQRPQRLVPNDNTSCHGFCAFWRCGGRTQSHRWACCSCKGHAINPATPKYRWRWITCRHRETWDRETSDSAISRAFFWILWTKSYFSQTSSKQDSHGLGLEVGIAKWVVYHTKPQLKHVGTVYIIPEISYTCPRDFHATKLPRLLEFQVTSWVA